MIVIATGGRHYSDRRKAFDELDRITRERGPITRLVQGGATGLDHLAKLWALERRVALVKTYPADWDDLNTPPVVLRHRRDGKPYNAAAGGIRNQKMLDKEHPSLVVAFPGGAGTADMVRRAIRAGVEVEEIA